MLFLYQSLKLIAFAILSLCVLSGIIFSILFFEDPIHLQHQFGFVIGDKLPQEVSYTGNIYRINGSCESMDTIRSTYLIPSHLQFHTVGFVMHLIGAGYPILDTTVRSTGTPSAVIFVQTPGCLQQYLFTGSLPNIH